MTDGSTPPPERCGHIDVPGGRAWYRMNGADHLATATPLLVIHGGPGMSHDYLLPFVDLAAERPVVLYDQLDCGNAEHPGDPGNWRIERFVREVDAVRDALGLDRVFILGNSWGGTIAAEYAIGNPAGLSALVLSSPLLSTPRWLADNAAHRARLPAPVRATLDAHEAAGTQTSAAYQQAVSVFYARHFNRQTPRPAEVEKTFQVLNEDLYQHMWGNTEFNASGTLARYDGSDRLNRISVPTLYTCGEFDEATPSACKAFCALTPGARLVVIADTSHTAFLERRDLYLGIVREFLAERD